MKYQVTLHNGQGFQITVTSEGFAEQATKELNDRTEPFINLGGCVVYKNTVATILPIQETTQDA